MPANLVFDERFRDEFDEPGANDPIHQY
jgi:hypothetical protein